MESMTGWTAIAWPYIVNVISAIIILIVGWMVANWVRSYIRKKGDASPKLDDTLTRLFANVARILILAFVVMAVLAEFDVETTSFVAVIGALGLAIGLAWQGVLADFAAGVMILGMRPFKVGDAVDIGGLSGKVEEVGLVTTSITSFYNVTLV